MARFFKSLSCSQRLFIFLSGLFCFRLIYSLLLPLSPQEAYYWVFSLHPALSYFDHPPLTAYTIYLFTHFFGPTALAVRLGALLYAFGFSWLLYLIGKRMFDERTGFLAALLANLLPTYTITFLIMTPDCPLVFFWGLAWFFVLKAVQEDRPAWYLWAGAALGLALTAKYTAIFFPFSTFLFLLISSKHRHHLIRIEPYLGLVIALLIFSPVLIWNAQHHWASLAFQSTERAGEMKTFSGKELGAFFASQIGIVSPMVFAGFCWAIGLGLKRFWRNPIWQETFLLSLALPMVALFTLVATREWVKMNWLIPAYAPLLLLMVAYYQNRNFSWKWIYRGYARWTWVSVGLFFLIFHLWPLAPQIKVSGSADTMTGWPELARHIETIRNEKSGQGTPFIFSWGHKTASELQFYLKGHPETFAQTILGKKALGYDYWFDPRPLLGRDVLFVWSDFEHFPDEKSGLLEKYFERAEALEPYKVYRGKYLLRTFYLYRCYGYKGYDFVRP
jgi:4-amino-4-deoxy-L-arabinose transferase-like glycosyltransferase